MFIKRILISTAVALTGVSLASPASAGTEAYIGEIMLVGYNFCPRASVSAEGQLLAINSNQALFSLYGTTYGGDGRTTFGIPDLRGRVPMGTGNGPGLSSRPVGQKGGTETNTMTVNQMPSHNHTAGIRTSNKAANTTDPKMNSFTITGGSHYYDGVEPVARFMDPSTVIVNNTGGNQSQNNIQPYTVMRYCVVTQGIFPSRN